MITLRRVNTPWTFYTGVTLEALGPGGNAFWIWPEEYWSWVMADGTAKGGFVKAEHVRDFAIDPKTGVASYKLLMAPEDCDIVTRVIPAEGEITLEFDIDNRGGGRVLGGSPCLQVAHARDFQSWTFEQAKRTFLWTKQDGFTWLADTRRTGVDVFPTNKCFCQNYHVSDPTKMHTSFGRSPDLAASPLIGSVSKDGRRIAACVGAPGNQVAHGLMNCLHSSAQMATGPGERKSFRYKMYFPDNDLAALVERARRDFPEHTFPPFDPGKMALCGEGGPLLTFDDERDCDWLRCDRARWELTSKRRLSVEEGSAPTCGVTHGLNAVLCEFEPGGSVAIASLFVPREGDRFFTIDLTLPQSEPLTARVCLKQGEIEESREFELLPAAPRRCAVPLDRVRPNGGLVDIVIAPADARACALQLDCAAVR